ncbi:UDP-N-acetylglucosamine:LPS N-acetylglucosamine transferase [Kutzneria viridogrisea]|uniref:UDP-N-acetylglucosamine:LPS N-acetylglucosamine transferase n=1 Tax=Kutzneria viridogrisea TaxID=47990 RepID=A0ABR6BUX0_9PSEU|nr:WS/DGAT domain-containing protein [Kutzneria albida]MBA8930680.1 UDP-N-acetylglucosamine:LPS N-acetylglucosamine transferase [Kutzneria viridogrisea]
MSADMGEGHNATGRALHAAVNRLWPHAQVHWSDVLTEMGAGVGPFFRRVYRTSVQRLPWLYEVFYGAVWRHRWFARSAKRVIGAWAGRKLASVLDRIGPDLVLSTYPMASTGLEWLRHHRGLTTPVGAWVSDFAPHPSWVHTGVDLNLVMHPVAAEVATRDEPGAVVEVSAPPVAERFVPGDRERARRRLGLPTDRFVALVSCGSLGFGSTGRTVTELLAGDSQGVVLVVAGRNDQLRRELTARFADNRVVVLGWVTDMASLMVAADVVVTNAGGATGLEALACGRAVVLHEPIAGHGRANAALMADAGLATVCDQPGELTAWLHAVRADPDRLREQEERALRYTADHRIEDGLRHLVAAGPSYPVGRVLPAADALFLHAQTADAPQQVGAVLIFEDTGPTWEEVVRLVSTVPGVFGRLVPPTALRRGRWVRDHAVDPADLVVRRAGDWRTIADEFFSAPLDLDRPVAAALVEPRADPDRMAVLIKAHHALGDGVMVLQALLSATGTATRAWAAPPTARMGTAALPSLSRLARGLRRLAAGGRAPASALDRAGTPRRHEFVTIPGDRLRAAARSAGCGLADAVYTVVAEALHRALPDAGHGTSAIRMVMPVSLRQPTSMRAAGNWTGAVPVDLPIGPMDVATRLHAVAEALREAKSTDLAEVARAVLHAVGWLPPLAHRALARAMYRPPWFNAIGTVLPGPRHEIRLNGSRIGQAHPVLPLAPGSGLSWGALCWGDQLHFCFTTAPGVDGPRLAQAVRTAAQDLIDQSVGRYG